MTLEHAIAASIATEDTNESERATLQFETGNPGRVSRIETNGSDVRGVITVGSGGAEGGARAIEVTARYGPTTGAANAAFVSFKVTNVTSQTLNGCALLVGKDYKGIGDLVPGQTVDARVLLRTGQPQTLRSLRSLNSGSSPYYAGRYYGGTQRSSAESSAPSTNSELPFDLIGAPAQDALANWQTYATGNTLMQESRAALVSAALGSEYVTHGAAVACWDAAEQAQSASLPNALYVDQHLRMWRVPVEPYLVSGAQDLVPDTFGWDILTAPRPQTSNPPA